MFKPNQARTLAVSSPVLPTYGLDNLPVLTPVRLVGTEALGELSEYTLDLVAVARPELPVWQAIDLVKLDGLIGREFTVEILIEGKGTFLAGQPGNTGMGNIGATTREITGLVTQARFLGADDRTASFQLTLRPWLHRATQTVNSRIFQDKTVVEITDEVLAPYGFPVEKRLIGRYPKRDYQRQCFESDFHFVARLWQEWGLYFWFEHSGGKHRLVLCDSPGAHPAHGPAYSEIRYHGPNDTRIDEEHIHALSVVHGLTPGAVSLVDYDYTRPRADLGVKYEDPRDTAFAHAEHYAWGDHAQPQAGATGLSGTPNQPRDEANMLARVRMDALRCPGLRATGKGNLRGLEVARTFHLTHYPQKSANREYVVVSATLDIRNPDEATVAAGSGAGYHCVTEFEIQPANAVFRSAQTLTKPTRTMETAIVTGPENQEIWTDALGRVKVQFPWDRQGRRDQNSSCWMRHVSSWQGNRFGAQYVPRIGHEVLVSYVNNDPDLPIITGSAPNAFNEPSWPLPANHAVSGVNSNELGNTGQSGRLTFDDTNGEIQTQLASDYGASQLSLGFLRRIVGKKGRQDARGKGFDLRSDLWGAMRAAMGLLITTEARRDAQGHAKDMGETVARLTQAGAQHEELARLAQRHQAQHEQVNQQDVTAGIKVQHDAIRGGAKTPEQPFPEMTRPDLLLASAAGIAGAAAESMHLASQRDHAVTAGRDVSLSVGRSLIAAVRGAVSLFAYQLGLKLIAAQGKVQIQAQQDGIEAIAKQGIEIVSTTDGIRLVAPKQIELQVNGATMRLGPEGFTVLTKGNCYLHGADHQTFGPEAPAVRFPGLPGAQYEQHYVLHDGAGKPVSDCAYQLTRPDGSLVEGRTDAEGKTMTAYSEAVGPVHCEAQPEDGADIVQARYWDDETVHALDFARAGQTAGGVQ